MCVSKVSVGKDVVGVKKDRVAWVEKTLTQHISKGLGCRQNRAGQKGNEHQSLSMCGRGNKT